MWRQQAKDKPDPTRYRRAVLGFCTFRNFFCGLESGGLRFAGRHRDTWISRHVRLRTDLNNLGD